jgi:hypothetical protein
MPTSVLTLRLKAFAEGDASIFGLRFCCCFCPLAGVRNPDDIGSIGFFETVSTLEPKYASLQRLTLRAVGVVGLVIGCDIALWSGLVLL